MAKVRLLDPKDGKRRLDRYELIGELASGGMATVFLARLGGVGGFQRFVAIKRLHPHLANEQDFIEMFLDEARLAAGIHHPHVVPILEVGESENGYYLVMEYVEGDTLARLMARSLARAHPIPRPVLIRMILDTLAGLHAAHELVDAAGNPVQLVHRDVSPQNVLVGVDGCSRITDFGVAHAASRLQNTRTDRLKGKLAYMSPEQARAGEVDRRSDVFAMGVILWEVLAAKRLFKGENEAITLQRVTVEPIPRLSAVVPGIHPALEQVCSMALERDRNKRFASAADMAEALERAARSAAKDSATDLGVASPREVASYVQAALGEDIAAQRESVRAWLAYSEPSAPKTTGARPHELVRPAGYDVTMTMPLDRDVAEIAQIALGVGTPRRDPRARPLNDEEAGRSRGGGEPRGRLSSTPVFGGAAADEGSSRRPSHPTPDAGAQGWPDVVHGAVHDAVHGAVHADGASADEIPVEPRDDDEEEHETLLMDREDANAAVREMADRKEAARQEAARQEAARQARPHAGGQAGSHAGGPSAVAQRATPLPSDYRITPVPGAKQPSLVAPFTEDGTPSKSIDFYMVPARPTPSRTPQLVAGIVTALVAAAGIIFWLTVRGDTARPALASTGSPVTPSATSLPSATAAPAAPAPAPTAVVDPGSTATTTGTVLTPSSLPNVANGKLGKGKLGKGKGKGAATTAAPPDDPPPATPPPAAPPPAPPPEQKVPEDMPNPYR